MAVLGPEGAPGGSDGAVDVFHEVADVFGCLVHAHTDDGDGVDGFGRLQHFNKAKAVGGIGVEAAAEGDPAFIDRAYHFLPAVQIGIGSHVDHGSVVPEGGNALAFEGVGKLGADGPTTRDASPGAWLQEGETEVDTSLIVQRD